MNSARIYADAIMVNNPITSSEEMVGGNRDEQTIPIKTTSDKPNGGFPPIIVCKKKVADEKIKQTKGKHIVSLQEIMQKRRDFSPFLPNK
jgi:hypothetical protein